MKMIFTKEFMQNMVYDDNPETEIVKTTLVEVDRWTILYEVIFKFDGRFFLSNYRKGSTEMQDESPYEYEDEITCQEVVPVQRTVTVWEVQND